MISWWGVLHDMQQNSGGFFRKAALLVGVAVLAGCTTVKSNVYHGTSTQAAPDNPKVVFFPADVEISIRNAGGDLELSDELSTEVAKGYNSAALNLMFERGIQYIPYGTKGIKDEHVDIIREANTILDSVELCNDPAKTAQLSG